MKTVIAVSFWFLVSTFSSVQAQLFSSAIPLMTQTTDVKTLSLANSNVAAVGRLGHQHINPAGIGINETLKVSFQRREFGLSAHQLSVETNFKLGNSAFLISAKELDTGEMYALALSDPMMQRTASDDIFIHTGYAYSFVNGFKIGAGVNYQRTSRFNTVYSEGAHGYNKALLFDIGSIYERAFFQNEDFYLQGAIGISLNDIGKNAYKLYDEEETIPYPTTFRLGGKLVFKTKDDLLGLSLVRLNLLAGLSKVMSRWEQTGEEGRYRAMSSFKTLFNSWGEYKYFDGHETKTVNGIEQIWLQAGFEMTLLDFFSFRFGVEDAAKAENVLDKLTYGLGIDLYYINLNYARVLYTNEYRAKVYSYETGHHWQLTGRIPLNGKRPDTVLHALFN